METKQLLSLSTPLSFSNFDIIKKSEFRPPHNQYGLELLREKAKNEKNMRELYHGRAPYELLQNADDAGAAKAVFILLPDGLAFLHNGRWFSVDNFVNLAKGWSDKAPDQCIGHKGLGFRSVLDITPSPFLVKLDKKEFFCVRFSWFLNHGHIQETLQKEPGCRPKYEKWTQHGEAACPIMYIPGISQKKNLGQCSTIYDMFVTGKYSSQYTTLFWFPAKDLEPDNKTIRELNHKPIVAGPAGRQSLLKFINGEVSALLPFLKSVREVSVFENDLEIASALILKDDERQQDGQLTVVMRPENKSRSYFKKSFFIPIPPAIRNKPDTPKALK